MAPMTAGKVDPALSSGLGLPRIDQVVPGIPTGPQGPLGPVAAAIPTGPQQPMVALAPAAGSASMTQSSSAGKPVRASVIIAIVLGILIGVIAVLAMQLLVNR